MGVEKHIRQEQARQLHENIPLAFLANLGGSICIALISWKNGATISDRWTLFWFGLMVSHSALKLLVWRLFGTKELHGDAVSSWLKWSVFDAGLVSVLWGAEAFVLISSGGNTAKLVMLVAICMLSVGGMFTYGSHIRSYVAFLIPYTLCTAAALLIHLTNTNVVLCFGVVILFILMLLSGKSFNRNHAESLRLRFESLELVEELRHQKQMADTANQTKSRFLAAASHDLRQPMYALNLYQGLMESMPLPDEARSLLSRARDCTRTMDEMFAALLDLSRLDSGVVVPAITSFSMAGILENILVEFEPAAEEKGLDIRIVPCSVRLCSDAAMVERILRNFVSNAIKYTSHGKLLIGCRRRKNSLRIEVWDTGQGIPNDQVNSIFDEFYQIGNPKRDPSRGMGLGLAIVSKLSKLLDSSVTVRSKPGNGSMFAIELPRCRILIPIEPNESDHRENDNLSGKRILVVDDEALVLDAVKTLLTHWDMSVIAVSSYAEANLPYAPDALICDYQMPGARTGIDIIKDLRSTFDSALPALIVTGSTAPEVLYHAKENDIHVLHKPLQPEMLKETLCLLFRPESLQIDTKIVRGQYDLCPARCVEDSKQR